MARARSPEKPITSQGTSTPPSTTTSSRPPTRMAAIGPATSTRRPFTATTRPNTRNRSSPPTAASAFATEPLSPLSTLRLDSPARARYGRAGRVA